MEIPKTIEAARVPSAAEFPTTELWVEAMLDLAEWCNGRLIMTKFERFLEFTKTGGGVGDPMRARVGDYVIKGSNGTYSQMVGEIFPRVYKEYS